MGRDGMILGAAGRSHATNQTPHIGIYLVVSLMALGPFVIILSGHGPLDVINWMGTTATFGFMLAYLLVAVAAPIYLYRRGEADIAPLPGGVIRAPVTAFPRLPRGCASPTLPGAPSPATFPSWCIHAFSLD